MKVTNNLLAVVAFAVLAFLPLKSVHSVDTTQYWMKIRAKDSFERSAVANTGVSIEAVQEDYVVGIGNLEEKNAIEDLGRLEVSFPLVAAMDFPEKDASFHNYTELTAKLQELVEQHGNIARLSSIGKTLEGRDIWSVRISGDLAHADSLPAIILMGGHHAREHLSVELPLHYLEYLLSEYVKGNSRIQNLVNGRDIHIIPMVNPDGSEYDISGSYKLWRKNRSKNSGGTYGVDINRNYGYKWGGGGASTNPASDTYRGPSAFSEPESQAIKKYIEEHQNISILLSFHTYSKLILYPWGNTFDGIATARDKQVHETMANKMAEWNGYKAQQASALYIASGDTTDWAYGAHKIISFTFELDPAGETGWGGYYPGPDVIPEVERKNLEPVLYLIGYADNPYRVLDGKTSTSF